MICPKKALPRRSAWLVAVLVFAGIAIALGRTDTNLGRLLLPVEVVGEDGTTVSDVVTLSAGQAESARSLWLQIHGLQYGDQASVQVNASDWIPLDNSTVIVAEPGRSFGGIGGGFSTLVMTLSLPKDALVAGSNTIRFRFNHTDGFASGYRVLGWNFLTVERKKIIPPDDFVEDAPEAWKPPLTETASIAAGRELWQTAALVANSLPNSPRIQAHCSDCHAHDGRDLKYFNFSNGSIIARSRFHGLSTSQGEQIASYIRSLPGPNPGRPWNPPYQPGPGLDEQPVSSWSAGAGLAWALERDMDTLPYLLSGARQSALHEPPPDSARELRDLVKQITPDVFRPDGNLNPRQIPIALQLPDWSRWLPRVHPKDAWGSAFTQSDLGALYGEDATTGNKTGGKESLRALLSRAQSPDRRAIVASFARWSQARRAFLKPYVKSGTTWSTALAEKVYSTQLWQLVKTWELMQEFALEGRSHDLLGSTTESRSWCNFVPQDTAPAEAQIPNGPAGVGGSALTNEYFNASWYELQTILNSGNHSHRDRGPIDWVYVIGRYLDLYGQSHQPEPARLLVAVIKALQSTDPHLGPEHINDGWRPDENIDPRIMISPVWAPIFKPLPPEVRQAVTTALLAAWMEKNLQYPIARFLPLGLVSHHYTPSGTYGNISGGKVWDASQQFRNAGVPPDLVKSLQQWGIAFADRAARIQYK